MFREYLQIARTYVEGHRNEMVIYGVMIGVSFAIALAATGDVSEAIARASRKR